MARGEGDPTYDTYDPIWADGVPLEPGYPTGYRTLVSLFASPSYHSSTMIMQVMDNEEYASSPPAVGRRSVSTGLWEQAAGPVDKVALIDYGDGAGTFVWDTFIPPIVWPPTSDFLYTVKYKSTFTDTTDDFQWVQMDADYPFAFSKRSPTPQDKGRSDYWGRLHCCSYNSDASMLVGQHDGSGVSPGIHTKWSMWAPGPNAIGFFKSNDAGFSSRYGNGTSGNGTIPQGFIIDKHDHLWVFTHANVNQSVQFHLDEYSWAIVGTDITLTFLNRYELINQDGGFNTWSYSIHGATYNEDLDEIVFYWVCAFPSDTNTNRDPVAIDFGGAGNTPNQYRVTHWDLSTRTKKLSEADSVLITKESDGLLLTDFGNTTEEPGFAGIPGFLGSDMNEDGDHYTGTWTKADWMCLACRNEVGSRTWTAINDGFFYVDLSTGVATKYADWTGDLLPDPYEGGPDPPGSPGIYNWAGAVYEPTQEKFWSGRRNQGFAGINGPEPEEVWFYVTEGFGIYGWESCPTGEDCVPCEADTEPCGETVEPACLAEWPLRLLQPRSVGIFYVPANIGGGPAMAGGNEQVAATANGFWKFTYADIPIHDLPQILRMRELEVLLEGRAGVICLQAYEGKRAPWLTVGSPIVASADSAIAADATSGSIKMTSGGVLRPGMFFSWENTTSGSNSGPWLYCLETVGAPSGSPPVYPVTFVPPARAAIADDDPLEFDHPMCRGRLADDRGLTLELDLLEHASHTVEFEEAI